MKVEDYLRMYNGLARWIGMPPIERIDGPHEKGKPTNRLKSIPFHLSSSR